MAEILIQDINEQMTHCPEKSILEAERHYFSDICDVADALEREKRQIIMIAGPSGAGKTTTANILKDILTERGHLTVVVSLDNFYREKSDPEYPRDEHGELDYESVDALHVDMINECIASLLRGESVDIPRYVFGLGKSYPGEVHVPFSENGFIIMEGIHALNPRLTAGIEPGSTMKIFISVSTNLTDGERRLLSGRKVRFVRRMTRDSLYRNTSADKTLERWKSVLSGEDKYLYPYRHLADINLDTFHSFELSAMKPYALDAIRSSGSGLAGEYIETVRSALEKIEEIPLSLVPETSLIREFIPGGKYEDIYKSGTHDADEG
ncbi:MAG: zeta toxin family protein [Eubacteriales bacterium]